MPPPPPPTNLTECFAWTWHRCFHDCFKFHRPPHLHHQPVNYKGFVTVFLQKILLEVCGAAGAVWGFAEICEWRNSNGKNEELFRTLSLLTTAVFVVRLYWHAKHWLEHEHDFPYVKIHHRRHHLIHFAQVFSAKLLLQVCGAAGAIWGAAQAAGLRTDATQEAWRVAAQVTGWVFFIRWWIELAAYCLLCQQCTDKDRRKDDNKKWITAPMQLVEWNQVLVVKFVLEVCGSVGAVWGFAEIVKLRTADNSDTIWRPIALSIGSIFCLVWLYQTAQYIRHKDVGPLVTEPMTLQKRSSMSMPASARVSFRNIVRMDLDDDDDNGNNGMAADNEYIKDKKDSGSDDLEMPSNTMQGDEDDSKEDDFAKLGADLRLVTTGETKESYNSFEENETTD